MHFILGTAAAGGMTAGIWTTFGSSDAVTAGLDGVDRWGTTFNAATLVRAAAGTPHSWYVTQSPVDFGDGTGPYYLIYDWSTGVDTLVNIIWSKNAPTGGTTSNRPTAVGEVVITNRQIAQNPIVTSRIHGLLADTGDFMIFHNPAAAAGFFPYCMMFLSVFNVAVSTDVARVIMLSDFIAGGQGALERNQILVGGAGVTDRVQTRNFTNATTLQCTAISPAVAGGANSQLFLTLNLGDADAASGIWDAFAVWFYAPLAANETIKGRIPDVYWCPDNLPMASVMPISGPPYTAMKLANFWIPWPASVRPTGFALNEVDRSDAQICVCES